MDLGIGKTRFENFRSYCDDCFIDCSDCEIMLVFNQDPKELNGLTPEEYEAGVRWMPGFPIGFHRVSYSTGPALPVEKEKEICQQ